MSIKIITDSGSDLTVKEAKLLGVEVLPLTITHEGIQYRDGIDLEFNDFYKKMNNSDTLPKTSQVTPFAYEEAFQKAIDDGDEVICITLSSKLSGCYQSAMIARDDNPKIHIIDSLNASIGQRLLVMEAIKLRGKEISEIVEELENLKKRIKVVALLDTLDNLRKGGRISSFKATAASLLHIKVVAEVQEGTCELLAKSKGRKLGLHNFHKLGFESAAYDSSYALYLAYGGENQECLDEYINKYGLVNYKVAQIGAAIGTHLGNRVIAIAFVMQEKI